MDERDLEPEQSSSRHGVDELRTPCLELLESAAEILRPEGDVVHPGSASGEKPPHGSVVAGRAHELDPTLSDEHRRGLDALLDERFAVLDQGPEEALVRRNRLVQIDDGDAEVVNAACPHSRDAIRAGQS